MAQGYGSATHEEREHLMNQRWELLEHIDTLFDKPMIALSFVWIFLLVLDYAMGLSPLWNAIENIIWGLFIVDFVLEFSIAPHKVRYLRRHWLTALSLVLPMFRVFRIVQIVRAVRVAAVTGSFSLVRIVATINRGMAALRSTVGQRGIGYVAALTVIITFVGAAGMFSFESQQALRAAGYGPNTSATGLRNFGDALWWTAMIMTTMGSAYWPVTAAGRILCFLLALYAFAIFGYITATIASYFIGRNQREQAQQDNSSEESTAAQNEALRQEIASTRMQMAHLLARLDHIDAQDSKR